jgi:hypothetical protein
MNHPVLAMITIDHLAELSVAVYGSVEAALRGEPRKEKEERLYEGSCQSSQRSYLGSHLVF